MRRFYCPLCGKPAEVVGVGDVLAENGARRDDWKRVDLECHNDPGCPILEARIELPKEELSE